MSLIKNIVYSKQILSIVKSLLIVFPIYAQAQVVNFIDEMNGEDVGMGAPWAVIVSPDGHHVYVSGVTADDTNGVLVTYGRDTSDAGRLSLESSINNSQEELGFSMESPRVLSMSADGQHLYVGALNSNGSNAILVFARENEFGDENFGQLSVVEVYKNGSIDKEDNIISGLGEVKAIRLSGDDKYLYVVSNDNDGSIVQFERDLDSGELSFIAHVHNNEGDIDGLKGTWDIQIADGFLNSYAYVSGTTSDSILTFKRDAVSGRLSYQNTQSRQLDATDNLNGVTSLVVTPDGKYLYAANTQSSNTENSSITLFQRDVISGEINYLANYSNNSGDIVALDKVLKVHISPDGQFLYASAVGDSALLVFSINPLSGELTLAETFQDGLSGIDGLKGVNEFAQSFDGVNIYTASITENKIGVFSVNHTNLNIRLRSSDNSVAIDELYYLDVKIENNGVSVATGVVISSSIPSNIRYISEDSTSVSCNQNNEILDCDIGLINPGEELEFQLTFEPIDLSSSSFNMLTQANEIDLDISDNQLNASVIVVPSRNSKSTNPDVNEDSDSDSDEWFGAINFPMLIISFGLVLLSRKFKTH